MFLNLRLWVFYDLSKFSLTRVLWKHAHSSSYNLNFRSEVVGRALSRQEIKYLSRQSVEFLDREMGWQFSPIDISSQQPEKLLFKKNLQIVVLIGENLEELKVLDRFPTKSVWIFLYADETFIPKLNKVVIEHHAVIGVIRSYPVSTFSLLKSLRKCLTNFIAIIGKANFSNLYELLRELPYGLMLIIRKHWVSRLHSLHRKPSLHLFPGYTNLFVEGMKQTFGEKIGCSTSLVRFAVEERLVRRKFRVGFVGQSGSAWRQYCLSQASERFSSDEYAFRLNNGFMGTLGSNGATLNSSKKYVEELFRFEYSLCPPGNYSYGSFRLLESLICGSVPVLALGCSYDSNYVIPFEISRKTISNSWAQTFIEIDQISELERQGIVKAALINCSTHIQDLNAVISSNLSVLSYDRNKFPPNS